MSHSGWLPDQHSIRAGVDCQRYKQGIQSKNNSKKNMVWPAFGLVSIQAGKRIASLNVGRLKTGRVQWSDHELGLAEQDIVTNYVS
jgi:hypothetical protein